MPSSTDASDVAPPGSCRGRDALIDALAEIGVTRLFGVMGDGNLGWLTLWEGVPGNVYVSARHEAGGVAMADGLAWRSGEPGWSTTTYGPGVLNAMNALATAHRGGAGHVLLTSTPSAAKPFHVQRYDHRALAQALGAQHVAVDRPSRIVSAVLHAHELARATRGLVLLDVDEDCIQAEVRQGEDGAEEPWAHALPERAADDLAGLDAVEAVLRSARRPVLLAGLGAERSGAAPAIVALAEATGALLATTLVTRGLFEGHPAYLGTFGGFTLPIARPLLDEADVVIVLGASLNDYTTEHGTLLEGKTVVQIDTSAAALGRQHPVTIGVRCDARVAAEHLAARWHGADRSVATAGVPTVLVPDADASDDSGIDPRVAMRMLDEWLPDDRAIIADGGHFIEWPSRYLRAPGPRSFRAAVAGGSIAMALPQAIGLASVGGSTTVACVMGDGGFFMALVELETAVRERIPVVIAVVDDRSYTAEVLKLRTLGLPEQLANFDDAADIAAVAAAMEAQSVAISAVDDIERLPDPAGLEGPLVIDLRVTRAVESERLAPPVA